MRSCRCLTRVVAAYSSTLKVFCRSSTEASSCLSLPSLEEPSAQFARHLLQCTKLTAHVAPPTVMVRVLGTSPSIMPARALATSCWVVIIHAATVKTFRFR